MFSFSQEVLATEGMDAPIAADMPQAAPSGAAAFRKDAPAEALGLGIRGSAPAAQAAALPEEPSRYFASIPEEDPMPHHAAPRTTAARPLSRGAAWCGIGSSPEEPSRYFASIPEEDPMLAKYRD